jgi:hypothetical protein
VQHRSADAVTRQESRPAVVTELEHAHTGWVYVWGSVPPAFSIGFEKPLGPWDSGFTVLFDDAPDPEEVPDTGEHPLVRMVCVGCLLEEHPEVGRGLEVACEYGVADLADDGGWMVGDLSRLT